MADFAGNRADTGTRAANVRASREEDVPVITAKVVHRDAERASMEAAQLGGVFDQAQGVWVFRATSTFELRGGVMRLRSAGLLPLEMRYGDQLEAIAAQGGEVASSREHRPSFDEVFARLLIDGRDEAADAAETEVRRHAAGVR